MTAYTPQPAPKVPGKTKVRVLLGVAGVAIALASCGVGAAMGSGPTKTVTAAAVPGPTHTVTVFATATVEAAPAVKPAPTKAPVVKPVIPDGYEVAVGDDVPAGTYSARSTSDMCYWEIDRHGTSDIVDNDIGKLGHITVTLKKGQDFASHDCGDFTKK
jgi:hypothetical protein